MQVVNVDEGACRMLVIWCWIRCGLGGCESYVEFVFPFQLRLEVKVACEFEVKSGKHEFKFKCEFEEKGRRGLERVIKRKKESKKNIPGVLSSAGKLCTAFLSSHSQPSTSSSATLRSHRVKEGGEPDESTLGRWHVLCFGAAV